MTRRELLTPDDVNTLERRYKCAPTLGTLSGSDKDILDLIHTLRDAREQADRNLDDLNTSVTRAAICRDELARERKKLRALEKGVRELHTMMFGPQP